MIWWSPWPFMMTSLRTFVPAILVSRLLRVITQPEESFLVPTQPALWRIVAGWAGHLSIPLFCLFHLWKWVFIALILMVYWHLPFSWCSIGALGIFGLLLSSLGFVQYGASFWKEARRHLLDPTPGAEKECGSLLLGCVHIPQVKKWNCSVSCPDAHRVSNIINISDISTLFWLKLAQAVRKKETRHSQITLRDVGHADPVDPAKHEGNGRANVNWNSSSPSCLRNCNSERACPIACTFGHSARFCSYGATSDSCSSGSGQLWRHTAGRDYSSHTCCPCPCCSGSTSSWICSRWWASCWALQAVAAARWPWWPRWTSWPNPDRWHSVRLFQRTRVLWTCSQRRHFGSEPNCVARDGGRLSANHARSSAPNSARTCNDIGHNVVQPLSCVRRRWQAAVQDHLCPDVQPLGQLRDCWWIGCGIPRRHIAHCWWGGVQWTGHGWNAEGEQLAQSGWRSVSQDKPDQVPHGRRIAGPYFPKIRVLGRQSSRGTGHVGRILL